MLLLTLLACPSPSTCDALPEPPVVAGCFGAGASDTGAWGPVTAEYAGTVAEVGTGAFPADCASAFGAAATDAAWWLRLTTDAGDVWIGVETPGSTAPAVGTEVNASVTYEYGEFSATQGSIALTAGDALVAWVAAAHTVDALPEPDGVAFSVGAATCADADECGTVSSHDLDVTVDGASGTVAYGTTATVGSLRVTHGGQRQVDASTEQCMDWAPDLVVAGIAPG